VSRTPAAVAAVAVGVAVGAVLAADPGAHGKIGPRWPRPPRRRPPPPRPEAPASDPAVRHVFLIVLENKSYTETWGPNPGAPYLGTTLRAEGNLLSQYYATSHDSLGNYISMVSGQPANPNHPGRLRERLRARHVPPPW
jgi:hypothetical protein